MKPAIDLKRKLTSSEPVLGILITDHLWLGLIEIAQQAGLDYVIIDTEHFTHDSQSVADSCALGRMTDFPVLLRPPATDTTTLRLAMDLGPCGLLLPMMESVEQLEEIQSAIYMPPRGRRRPGGPGNRWLKSFGYKEFKSVVEDHLIIVPQIESNQGVSNAQAIAQHELTTSLGIGPFDLSADLGVCYEPNHPKFQEAITAIRQAADQAGKPCWIIGNPEALLEQGFRFFCIGEPSALLQKSLAQTVERVRSG